MKIPVVNDNGNLELDDVNDTSEDTDNRRWFESSNRTQRIRNSVEETDHITVNHNRCPIDIIDNRDTLNKQENKSESNICNRQYQLNHKTRDSLLIDNKIVKEREKKDKRWRESCIGKYNHSLFIEILFYKVKTL